MASIRSRIVVASALLLGVALATREWTPQEFEAFRRTYAPRWTARPESLLRGPRRYNYLQRVRLLGDFVARHQVADSLSPDFGGIIEAEHMPNVIETDNTQEAIWVWSRWYELTGRDDYRENIGRAWVYVQRFPAYREHGGQPPSIWYAVWNCGLGLMAESRYRAAYGDSSFLPYADSCRDFYLGNPLEPWSNLCQFVTSQSSGMAYDYALERNDQELRDTALARGERVKSWIEEDARARLASADWAMSGGTAMWGVGNTVCREDTVAGREWLRVYAESLPGFYPTGTWNCSHNIWLANAYRASAIITGDKDCWLMHQYLVDTLLTKDTDLDGGIPATWTEPPTQDQTWISTYLDFMGFDLFVTPTFEHDVSALEFASPRPDLLHVIGDTIPVRLPVANVGLSNEAGIDVLVSGPGYEDTITLAELQFLGLDTVDFRGLVATNPGIYELDAITAATGDQNPLNDTSRTSFKVYGVWTIHGTLLDSTTGAPIHAWLLARIKGDSAVWDSAETDRSGNFDLRIIDTTVSITLKPFPPYYSRNWEFTILGDTTITLLAQTAHLMLVNNDTLERFAEYYAATFDTLGVSYFVWTRPSSGVPPFHLVSRLRTPTIIWYSGNSAHNTVTDTDSLEALAASGINLLLTGQNIAQELAGSPFLEQFVGCRFDSSGWSRFFVFGSRADSLGALIPATATAGGSGAGNQTSRDMLSPINGSAALFHYDTVSQVCAGTRRSFPGSGTKVILLGFGFEAVNRPLSMPSFLTRVEVMGKLLSWFGLGTGIHEPRVQCPKVSESRAGTVVRSVLRFPDGQRLHLVLLDISGRKTCDLGPGANDLSHLPAGVFFVLETGGNHLAKVVILD